MPREPAKQGHRVRQAGYTAAWTVSALRQYGLEYLLLPRGNPETHAPEAPAAIINGATPTLLLRRLAIDPAPRIRDALVCLVLLHPSFISPLLAEWRRFREESAQRAAVTLAIGALAAVYARRVWYPALALALRDVNGALQLPEERLAFLWQEAGLPPPSWKHGAPGLERLAAYASTVLGGGAPTVGDWQNQIEQLIAQRWSERRYQASAAPASASLGSLGAFPPLALPSPEYTADEEEHASAMSMRQDVDSDDITRFLSALGSGSRSSGRIYLVGGSELVHAGVRGVGATTRDIDLKLDVADETEVERLLQTLKVSLNLNLELSSPTDFIPVPQGWESRSQFVGRFGSLDVFYFDFVSLALAKMARAQARDVDDVMLLALHGVIQRAEIEAGLAEILPQLGHGRFFNLDPQRIEQQARAIIAQAWLAPPQP